MIRRHASANQQDRCSLQNHLWRRSEAPVVHMRCQCGAVHPNDLDEFLRALLDGAA